MYVQMQLSQVAFSTLLAFFVNFHFCLFHLTNRGLIFFFFFNYFLPSSCLHKEVQWFSWPQEEAGYYNNFCYGDIVSGMLDRLYMPNEEEENIPLQKKKKMRKTKGNNITSIVLFTQTQRNIYIYIYIYIKSHFSRPLELYKCLIAKLQSAMSINMFQDSEEKIAQSIITFYSYNGLFRGK